MTNLQTLPPVTQPPTQALTRQHQPRLAKQSYTLYRDCLRWDFGFTCAVCLLHERDWMCYGAEGSGVMQIEHFIPQILDPARIADYDNLLYVCRHCNRARSDTPNEEVEGTRRLLNPSETAWAEHFTVSGDSILAKPGDGDAEYTAEVYAINEPRKVRLRRRRRERITQMIDFLGKCLALEMTLGSTHDSVSVFRQETRRLIIELLGDYGAIPEDAPATCRCVSQQVLMLPESYRSQIVEFMWAEW